MNDLISLSAFPKSGVTYLGFLLFYCLFSEKHEIRNVERDCVRDIHLYPNLPFDEASKPHIIKSHFPYLPSLPYIGQTSKAIYLIRHPIDIMMSAWDFNFLIQHNKSDKAASPDDHPEFRPYVRHWLESQGDAFVHTSGTWVQHVGSWLNQTAIPIHLVHYQKLVADPLSELTKIFKFLEIDVSPEKVEFAIEQSSMKAMASFEEKQFATKTEGIFFRKALEDGLSRGNRFVNKGYHNCYWTVLTDEERGLANKAFEIEFKLLFPETLSAPPAVSAV